MKILIISNISGCSWAGSETYWQEFAMKALGVGNSVTAMVHSDLMASDQICEFCKAGGEVRNWSKLRIARFQYYKEKLAPSFSSKILDSYDVIIVSLGSLPAMTNVPGLVDGLFVAKTPIILICQFNSDHLIISQGERHIVSRVMKQSSSTIFCSQRNLIQARRQFAMEPPNARVINNPIRNRGHEPCAWPDDAGQIYFASVARFEVAWKGQDLLLDVLSQPQWRDRNWHLNLYGEGSDREYLERLIVFYALLDRVSFKGHEKKINAIWSSNHILVMPSHGEGTPLAALEAMMAGRPVIATDVGGNAEIIRDGETGFIAEVATLGSFSRVMERAWESRSHWKAMGEAARRNVSEGISRDPALDLLEICSSLVFKK